MFFISLKVGFFLFKENELLKGLDSFVEDFFFINLLLFVSHGKALFNETIFRNKGLFIGFLNELNTKF